MEKLTLTNSDEILKVLSSISLKGEGFITDCLVGEVMDAGINEPDHFTASGSDPNAYYDGEPNAWANYQVRQSKKVFMVYGRANKARRFHIADTP